MKRSWTMVAILCAVSGCGGKNAEAFVGTWDYTAGKATTTCNGQKNERPQTGNEVIRLDKSGDLLVTKEGCDIHLTMSGKKASAKPGQKCDVNKGGVTGSFTYRTIELELDGEGKTMKETGSGEGTFSNGQETIRCTVTVQASLAKSK